jgi:soluble lytic murein transglycosylase-like protein
MIKHHLNKILGGLHPKQQGYGSKKPDIAGNFQRFHQILSSCLLKQPRASGLKASDYLAHPLPKKSFQTVNFKSIPEAAPSQNEKGEFTDNGKPAVLPQNTDQTLSSAEQKTKMIRTERKSAAIVSRKKFHRPEQKIIEKSIHRAAARYRLTPELIKAVIKAESNFDVDAVSPAGAQGLMQLMPATAEELGVKNPFDIEQNIDGGSLYLKKMLDRFDGDVKLALAAYNAGPAAVEKYGGNLPYPETKHYINRVLRFIGQAV